MGDSAMSAVAVAILVRVFIGLDSGSPVPSNHDALLDLVLFMRGGSQVLVSAAGRATVAL
jgi:hypothetical protein